MKTKVIAATLVVLFLVGMLSVALNPLTMGHTEDNPFVTDLIAGQTMDAGDVSVWNDGSHLFVKFETTGEWVMLRTHLAVDISPAGIPQNRKGIPSPGHFPYSSEHNPSVTEFVYSIELNGWTPGTDLFIAAHAVVCGPSQPPIFAEGVLAVIPLLTWNDAINIGTVTASIVGDNLIVNFDITFAGWVMLDTHLNVAFTPPGYPPDYSAFPFQHEGLGGVTTDSYSISLTSLGVQCDDVLYISAHTYASYPTVSVFRDAWSELDPSSGWEKYFLVIIPCEMACETAWGNGFQFTDRNWAMYFTYTVQ